MKTSTIIIGEKEIQIPQLNFKLLKKVYPILRETKPMTEEEAKANPDLALQAVDQTIKIISIALERSDTPMTVDEIEEALLPSEIPGLHISLMDLLKNNGLTVSEGESKAAGKAANHSTGTSTRSSAKSSPASEQRTGT